MSDRSDLQLPISIGRELKLLECNLRSFSDLQFPMLSGRDLKLFPSKVRYISDVNNEDVCLCRFLMDNTQQ